MYFVKNVDYQELSRQLIEYEISNISKICKINPYRIYKSKNIFS